MVIKPKVMRSEHRYRGSVVKHGVSMGSALAIVLSYTQNSSVLWAIIHGILGWLYVIYFVIRFRLF